MLVCDKNCSACGACINICPKNAITYVYDIFGIKRADINSENCIKCNQCQKVCPILNHPEGSLSLKCFAAWSLDTDIRNNSASGGLATEMYNYAIKKDWWIAGAYFDDKHNCVYALENSDPFRFSGSKYTYSDTKIVFREIEAKIKENKHVLFVGLPCQVAGLKKYIEQKHLDSSSILLVDLLCHGVVPEDYLKSHISYIEDKKRKKTEEISFRDPEFQTYTYTFTLRNKGKVFYKKKVYRNDLYQIGYHKGIVYRDNCYHCNFANENRQGDLTLADFAGVGSVKKCDYDNKNVSCLLVNSKKGDVFFNDFSKTQTIFEEERPMQEEFLSEKRLHSPTPISKERIVFLKKYAICRSFEKSMKAAARKIIIKNEIRYYLHIDYLKTLIAKAIPSRLKNLIKKHLTSMMGKNERV